LVAEGRYPALLGRGYCVADMELMRSVGLASGYIAVLSSPYTSIAKKSLFFIIIPSDFGR
jgi:hypothetical protein